MRGLRSALSTPAAATSFFSAASINVTSTPIVQAQALTALPPTTHPIPSPPTAKPADASPPHVTPTVAPAAPVATPSSPPPLTPLLCPPPRPPPPTVPPHPPPSTPPPSSLPSSPPPQPPPAAPALLHAGHTCWGECGHRGGSCTTSFCGTHGACCRQGHDTASYECGFGARGLDANDHRCVLAVAYPSLPPPHPPSPPPSPLPPVPPSPPPSAPAYDRVLSAGTHTVPRSGTWELLTVVKISVHASPSHSHTQSRPIPCARSYEGHEWEVVQPRDGRPSALVQLVSCALSSCELTIPNDPAHTYLLHSRDLSVRYAHMPHTAWYERIASRLLIQSTFGPSREGVTNLSRQLLADHTQAAAAPLPANHGSASPPSPALVRFVAEQMAAPPTLHRAYLRRHASPRLDAVSEVRSPSPSPSF
jgi:hypothetical protein